MCAEAVAVIDRVSGTSGDGVELLVDARDICKRYGETTALRDVNFALSPGQAVAIIGENGAGKSTFAKIISGAVKPDSGELWLFGRHTELGSPRHALGLGIALIPQELAYVPRLTVAENLLLNRWPSWYGVTSNSVIRKLAAREAERLGFALDLDAKMSQLQLAERQVVEILKALIQRSRVLVLDEPTA